MNNPVNSNIYAFAAVRVLEKYSKFAQGDANCTIVVTSASPLGDAAVSAIKKSVDRLGFGADACAWIRLQAEEGEVLAPDELLEFLEGVDPISVIAADAESAHAVASAYELAFECDAPNRANGRTVVAFNDFSSMLNDKDSKQTAWNLLKKLS